MAGVAAFLAVVDRSSFSAAARELGMRRATVGAQVQALEKRLGVRLLHRHTRSVTPTEAGAAYRDQLAGVMTKLRAAESAATSLQTEGVGKLRISAAPDLGPRHLAPVVARYLERHPAISVELQLSTETVDLIAGGFDLAIRGALSIGGSLITRRLGCSAMLLCAAPAYVSQHGRPGSLEDLASHACLHFSELTWGRTWRFHRGDQAVDVPFDPRLESNDGQTLLASAAAGAGILLAPAFLVGPALRAGALVPLLPDWRSADLPLHAVFPDRRHIPSKVRVLVNMLAQAFAHDPDFQGRDT
jgi:DNA-binding transcriptional LysR family regulator